MSLDFDCDPLPSPAELQQKILDVLGSSFQTAGYISQAVGNQTLHSIAPSVLTVADTQQSISDNLHSVLQRAKQTLLESNQSITMLAANTYGKIQSTAGKCLRDCEASCGTIKNGILTLPNSPGISQISESAKSSLLEIPDFFPGGVNPFPNYGTTGRETASNETCPKPVCASSVYSTPEKPIYVTNVPAKSICPTSTVFTLVPLEHPLTSGFYHKWCNKNGESVIVKGDFKPEPIDEWFLNGAAKTIDGPWPDCPDATKPIPPINETQYRRSSESHIIIPSLCSVDFYTALNNWNAGKERDGVQGFVNGFLAELSPVNWVKDFAQSLFGHSTELAEAFKCADETYVALNAANAGLQLAEKWAGTRLPDVSARIRYALNARCQYILPTSDQSLAYYLSNAIKDEETLRKYVEVNGQCWEPWKLNIQTKRSKFIPDEIFALERRGICTTQSSNERLRELGYIDPTQWDCLRKLQQWIPQPQDLVRFMVRDVQDATIVGKFKLDAQFEDKFNGELRNWAKFNAVDDNVMRQFWRAHWRVPELHQLSEMYQRNRRHPYNDKRRLELADIKTALGQADYLPYWQDKLEDLLFRPISQRYIFEVYHYGGVNEDELFEHLCYVGYNDRDARIVTNGFEIRKKDGIYTTRPVQLYKQELINKTECKTELQKFKYADEFIDTALDSLDLHFNSHRDIKLYKDGIISYRECFRRLLFFGVRHDNIDVLLEGIIPNLQLSVALKRIKGLELANVDAEHELVNEGVETAVAKRIVESITADIDRELNLKCRDNVKRSFLHGEFNQGNAIDKLVRFGIAIDWANKLLASWECEKTSIGKTVPTNTLCDWFDKGVINAEEFAGRLVNIGYTRLDAFFLVSDCTDKINGRLRKKQDAALNRAKKQLEKTERELAADSEKEQRRLANLERARDRAKLAEQKRQNALMSATATYDKKSDYGPETSSEIILGVFNVLKSDFGINTDTAISAIQQSLDTITPENADQIGFIAANYIRASQLAEVAGDET